MKTMNCAGFERWLNAGMPASEAGTAKSHSVACPACARAWAAQRSIDSLLGESPDPTPPLFTEHVMQRVAAERRVRTVPALDPENSDLPWWIRFFTEPSTVLALAIASLLIGWGGKMWSMGGLIVSELNRRQIPEWAAFLSHEWLGIHPGAAISIGAVVLAAFVLLSVGLYRGVMRAISA
jgi:hypothetical protein